MPKVATRPKVAAPKKPGRPERSARNDAFTDREMLGIVDECAKGDASGWATTTDIGIKMGWSKNGDKNNTPAVKVATRLAWMRDAGGLIESMKPDANTTWVEPGDRDTRWRLLPDGQAILSGKLTQTIERALEKMDVGALVALQRELMRTGWISGTQSSAFAINRQFQHDRAQRQIVWRAPKAK